MAESREREEADFYSMFLFSFTYQGESHLAACNESNLENFPDVSSTSYQKLASISIECYLKGWRIEKEGVKPRNVKIYKVNDIEIKKLSTSQISPEILSIAWKNWNLQPQSQCDKRMNNSF